MNKHLRAAQYITDLLENRFRILGIRFGLDPILGIFPGFGDIVTAALSAYLVWIAVQMKVPSDVVSKMLQNILVDFLVGIIPVLGDLSDFVYKANTRNMKLLRQYGVADARDAEIIS